MHRAAATLVLPFVLSASLPAQGVFASAQRLVYVEGEAQINVAAAVPASATLDAVLEDLKASGVSSGDLIRRAVNRQMQQFVFHLRRPQQQYAGTLAALQAAASAKPDPWLRIEARTGPVQAAIDRAREEIVPTLFAEARERAARLLVESGYQPGAVTFLDESIEVDPANHQVLFALRVGMTRLSGGPPPEAEVVTSVAPPPTRYRLGSPVMEYVYIANGTAETRQQILAKLSPAGVTEEHLTLLSTGRNYYGGAFVEEPAPLTIYYSFRMPVRNEAAIPALLAQLPEQELYMPPQVNFEPVAPDPGQAQLMSSARSRARVLAALVGGEPGEFNGFSASSIFGRFAFIGAGGSVYPQPRPAGGPVAPNAALGLPYSEPLPRYRFAVTAKPQ